MSSHGGSVTDRVVERLPHPLAGLVRRLRREDVLLLAAGLAFYALVSVVPFVILVLWVIGLVSGEDQVQQVATRMGELAPPELDVGGAFERVAALGAGLGVGSLVALLWPATSYGAGLSRAFDRLSEGDVESPRGLRGRALALALVGMMPALALVGLVASYAGTRILGEGLVARLAGWLLALALGFLAALAASALIYRLYSPRKVPRGGLLRGSAVAAASISVLSLAYVVFLNLGTDFQARYATSGLAAVVLLAVWLFLANALILVGYQVAQGAGRR